MSAANNVPDPDSVAAFASSAPFSKLPLLGEGCQLVSLPNITKPNAGALTAIDANCAAAPFAVARVYYIHGVPRGARRGYHAHKVSRQLMLAPVGKILFHFDNGLQTIEVILDRPDLGILITAPIWREFEFVDKPSCLIVLCDRPYEPNDYIWDLEEFRRSAKHTIGEYP